MLMLALLSIILVSELKHRQTLDDRTAFEFSVAQTDRMLNAIYAHFDATNEWPASNGSCLIDFDSYEGAALVNGWGQEVTCELVGGNYRNAREFTLVQPVPQYYEDLLIRRFEGGSEEYRGSRDAPAGFVLVSVSVNRSGGARQTLDFSELTHKKSIFERMECSGSAERFVALNAMETHLLERGYIPYTNPLYYVLGPTCTEHFQVRPYPERNGFAFDIEDSESDYRVNYDFYRKTYRDWLFGFPAFDDSNWLVTREALDHEFDKSIADDGPCASYLNGPGQDDDVPWYGNPRDAHLNADYTGADGHAIGIAMFQYCED